jgi:MFS family permease
VRLALPRSDPNAAPKPSTLIAWRNRNFRLYLVGQAVSQIGNWFQQTAEVWLILLLTDSGTAVGIQTALRFGPLLLFGIPAGYLTDRVDRRYLLFGTQLVYILSAGAIAVTSFTGTVNLPLVYLTAFSRGIVNAIDNPLRRGFIRDLVNDEELTNAVSLNSTMHTIARFIGPALAGAVIVALGVSWCFTINTASYTAVLLSLFLIDRKKMRQGVYEKEGGRQIFAGLKYAWENRRIRRTLAMVTVFGLFVVNWDVVLPLYAKEEWGGNASLYGFFVSTIGIGSFLGAMVVLRVTRIAGSFFRWTGAVMAVGFAVVAFTPLLLIAFVGLAVVGAMATSFQIFAQSRLQLEAEDRISGRVLALYSIALVGMRPIGAPIMGFIVDTLGSRVALGFSGVVMALMVVTLLLTRVPRGAADGAPIPSDVVRDAEDADVDETVPIGSAAERRTP